MIEGASNTQAHAHLQDPRGKVLWLLDQKTKGRSSCLQFQSQELGGCSVRAQIYFRLVPTSCSCPFLAVQSQCQCRMKADLMGRQVIRNTAFLVKPYLSSLLTPQFPLISLPRPQVYLVICYLSCSPEGPHTSLASSALHRLADCSEPQSSQSHRGVDRWSLNAGDLWPGWGWRSEAKSALHTHLAFQCLYPILLIPQRICHDLGVAPLPRV